ncbi:MAG: hypothetical protein KAZ54_02085, partial [Candidatus Planktophila sp.]|nr:hypothetical protein [Candidatus Planktophila sp.]
FFLPLTAGLFTVFFDDEVFSLGVNSATSLRSEGYSVIKETIREAPQSRVTTRQPNLICHQKLT